MCSHQHLVSRTQEDPPQRKVGLSFRFISLFILRDRAILCAIQELYMESGMDSVLGERVLSVGLSVVTAQIRLAGKKMGRSCRC